jgi:D-alanine-D-alanine ligase
MLFAGVPAGKPRIVGYDAKWVEDSFEYGSTPRRFDFPPQDEALLRRLEGLALAAWGTFAAGGYARVDFRLDADGAPHILELNANPCLSPEGGFAAAMTRAGIDYTAGIARILAAGEARAALCRLPALATAGV